jgi:hypothetical protein
MFFLFNSLRGALWNNTSPADSSNPSEAFKLSPKDLCVYSTKGVSRGEKIEVSEKIFELDFI